MYVHYVPTVFGDIRLEPAGDGKTRLVATKLTAQEKAAVAAVLKKAVAKGWTDVGALEGGGTVVLATPIAKVAPILARALKPTREILTAVRVTGGKLTEIRESALAEGVEVPTLCPTCGEEGHVEDECWKTKGERQAEADKVGVSAAVPCKGCAMPYFDPYEVAATRVLAAFLTPEQAADWAREQAFVSIGADTGHAYLVSSRHAYGRRFGPRDLRPSQSWLEAKPQAGLPYDLDEGRTLCVHDWEVPPAEEALAVHLCLSLPGREGHLRELPSEHRLG